MSVEAIVEPELLVWGRRTAGLSVEEAARLIRVQTDRLAAWESGDQKPTMGQLRKLAEKYRRPLNVFFLEAPPPDAEIEFPDFRTLPEGRSRVPSRQLRFALRRMSDWRLDVLDLYNELEIEPRPFELRLELNDDPDVAGSTIRERLRLPLEHQLAWPLQDAYRPFNEWRTHIEASGALVFQSSRVPVEEMRAASLPVVPLPAILVNSGDAPQARVFSLAHELVHLALRRAGLCTPSRIRPIEPTADPVEVFCNHVAAALLVPRQALLADAARHARGEWEDGEIIALANKYRVSKFVVLRRLLTLGRTTAEFYDLKHRQWLAQIRPRPESGGDGVRNALSARGRHYSQLVLSAYNAKKITLFEAARYLGVKANQIGRAKAYVGA